MMSCEWNHAKISLTGEGRVRVTRAVRESVQPVQQRGPSGPLPSPTGKTELGPHSVIPFALSLSKGLT